MPDVRTSFVIDDQLLSRLDEKCRAERISRSEYLRDLIYKGLGEEPPQNTLKLVQVRSTDWIDYKVMNRPGAPRFVAYRSDGSFHTETAGSVQSLFGSAQEYEEARIMQATARATVQAWRGRMCQPVYVGTGPRIGFAWGDREPDIQPDETDFLIQYIQPYTSTPENRLNIQVATLDPDSKENVAAFEEMISVLKRSADDWRNNH